MPLDKFVLILVAVIAAAGATVWVATTLLAAASVPALGWLTLIPVVLAAYVAWRVIADRVGSAEDDHYDGIEK